MEKNNPVWKILFGYALKRLHAANIRKDMWSFGGGTVLMLKYNHRMSKDIDIFFRDPQLLSWVSPRVNDAEESLLVDYSEHTRFTKLQFEEGEVDFIVSPQLTNCKPSFEKVEGIEIYVEDPVEIVAKKIHYRAKEFIPRDVFDLAVVYSFQKNELLENSFAFAPHLKILTQRIKAIAESGELESRLCALDIAADGEKFRGKELDLCRQFIRDMEQKYENFS